MADLAFQNTASQGSIWLRSISVNRPCWVKGVIAGCTGEKRVLLCCCQASPQLVGAPRETHKRCSLCPEWPCQLGSLACNFIMIGLEMRKKLYSHCMYYMIVLCSASVTSTLFCIWIYVFAALVPNWGRCIWQYLECRRQIDSVCFPAREKKGPRRSLRAYSLMAFSFVIVSASVTSPVCQFILSVC